jgi:oxygen-independent coproporphyrinogen-3 oxidase
MAGIYIHIPFCKQACTYCDFHFSTSLKGRNEFLNALLIEIGLRKNYLPSSHIDTIYFGGGTPSLLDKKELEIILKQLRNTFTISPTSEITLEANPDDITSEKLQDWKHCGINRLSIGIQSFFEEDLKFMNRAHNAIEGKECLNLAKRAGFNNITIDLIYGTPTLTNENWKANLETAFAFNIPHLSCYMLTVEKGTALDHLVKKKKVSESSEEKFEQQFNILLNEMTSYGYEQYEISNFSKPGMHSRHNSNYWKYEPYIGFGPSAHSFNGAQRHINVSNNAVYTRELMQNIVPLTEDELSIESRYNEYILISLRTKWGTDLEKVETLYPGYLNHLLNASEKYISQGLMIKEQNHLYLTNEGKLVADAIASDLFIV